MNQELLQKDYTILTRQRQQQEDNERDYTTGVLRMLLITALFIINFLIIILVWVTGLQNKVLSFVFVLVMAVYIDWKLFTQATRKYRQDERRILEKNNNSE